MNQTEIDIIKHRACPECGKPWGDCLCEVHPLAAQVAALTAERDYARSEIRRTIDLAGIEGVRARNEWQKVITERDALRLDLARVTEHEASLERQLEDTLTWRNAAIDEARAATADLARLTVDAAAECWRLRDALSVDEAEMASLREWLRERTAERDALLAAMRKIAEWEPRTGQGDADVFLEARCFAIEAVAACAPEVKP